MAKLLIAYTVFLMRWLLAAFCALLLTLCASIFIFIHDPLVLDFLENSLCKQASNAFECDFNAQIPYVDVIHGTIFLTNIIVMQPVNTKHQKRAWFWTSDSIRVQLNWAKLIAHKQVVLTISCGTMQIDTQIIDGQLAIAGHIQAFTREKEMAIPIIPEKVLLQQAHIAIHTDTQTVFTCNVTGAIELMSNKQHIGLTVSQDNVMYNQTLLARDLKLSIKNITDMATKKTVTDVQGTIALHNLLDGSWCSGKIRADIQQDSVGCYFVSDDQKTELSFLKKIMPQEVYHVTLKTLLGTLAVHTDLKKQADIIFESNGTDTKKLLFAADYVLQPDHITLAIHDDSAHELQAQIYYDGHYSVQCATDFFHALLQKNIVPPEYQPLIISCGDFLNHSAPLVIQGTPTKQYLSNFIDISGLQLRIPYTYNFLRAFHTTCVVGLKSDHIVLHDTLLQTDRGRLISGISTLGFDKEKKLHYAHVPIMVQDFFINRAKDFFAELSGACILEYHTQARSKIKGICAIKKCHIRNNPFSGGVGNDIVAATINPLESHPLAQTTDLDVILHSYEPVEIKTDFLQARAQVKLQVLGTVSEPQLYGQIELLQGTLNFPYKPLEIQYGKIFFVDNERDDPAIELAASAVIKNYAITLCVDGTAQNPIITFQSTPSLQEEQIIGLLFGGSPDSSLSLVMPLSSMGIVEKLIVGSSDEFEQAGLKNWLGPLENVKIVPRFSDQTSRGGLRAALAIEVNENLSALIQQNFSLSEDVLIEVAYKPLDELTIRGMRDERGDFGGEVEARFTW